MRSGLLGLMLILSSGCGGSAPEDGGCGPRCSAADADMVGPSEVGDLAVATDAASPGRDAAQPPPDLAPSGDPLQPATDPDDVALKDPNRPSYCMGLVQLPPERVVDFFPDGWGYWNLAAFPRNTTDDPPLEIGRSTRNCNPLTGCDAGYTIPFENQLFFYFTYDDMNRLWLQQYDQGAKLITQRLIDSPVTTASFAVEPLGGTQYDMRRFAVMLTEQRICLETLWSTTISNASGSQEDLFSTSVSYDHTSLPARPSPQPLPSPSPSCTGPAATQAELLAWFQPGSSGVDLEFNNMHEQSTERECHPLTGCSAWGHTPEHFWGSLSIQNTSILLNAVDPGVGTTASFRDYLLTNSEFSSSDLDIVFTATCGRASGHIITKGPHFNNLETVTASSVDK